MPCHPVRRRPRGTDLLAERFGITREEQDAFAVGSHRRAAAGVEIAPALDVDEVDADA